MSIRLYYQREQDEISTLVTRLRKRDVLRASRSQQTTVTPNYGRHDTSARMFLNIEWFDFNVFYLPKRFEYFDIFGVPTGYLQVYVSNAITDRNTYKKQEHKFKYRYFVKNHICYEDKPK